MASPVAYSYEPNTNVYVINTCTEGKPYVTQGTIIRVRIEVLVTRTTIRYDIRLMGDVGTYEFSEADVFPDKATALTEYNMRVE